MKEKKKDNTEISLQTDTSVSELEKHKEAEGKIEEEQMIVNDKVQPERPSSTKRSGRDKRRRLRNATSSIELQTYPKVSACLAPQRPELYRRHTITSSRGLTRSASPSTRRRSFGSSVTVKPNRKIQQHDHKSNNKKKVTEQDTLSCSSSSRSKRKARNKNNNELDSSTNRRTEREQFFMNVSKLEVNQDLLDVSSLMDSSSLMESEFVAQIEEAEEENENGNENVQEEDDDDDFMVVETSMPPRSSSAMAQLDDMESFFSSVLQEQDKKTLILRRISSSTKPPEEKQQQYLSTFSERSNLSVSERSSNPPSETVPPQQADNDEDKFAQMEAFFSEVTKPQRETVSKKCSSSDASESSANSGGALFGQLSLNSSSSTTTTTRWSSSKGTVEGIGSNGESSGKDGKGLFVLQEPFARGKDVPLSPPPESAFLHSKSDIKKKIDKQKKPAEKKPFVLNPWGNMGILKAIMGPSDDDDERKSQDSDDTNHQLENHIVYGPMYEVNLSS